MKPKPRPAQKHISRNPQQSRERILTAALDEFAAKGFAGARVDVIARRAHINKRMLYHYFGDKEGLFREILRRKIAERAAWLASAPEDPAERLPFWFGVASRDPQWIRLLEWEALRWGEEPVIEEDHRKEACLRAIEQFRQLQKKGLLPSAWDPGQLLLSMMALTAYPQAFPQLTRLVTGLSVSAPRFREDREHFLRQFAAAITNHAKATAQPVAPPASRKIVQHD